VFVGRGAQVFAGESLPPLTEAQRRQLDTAIDFSEELDTGAWYPLMANAATWKDQPMPSAPLITHTEPIIGAPQEYRGDLLRIEGLLAGPPRKIKLLRPGPWPSEIEQWVVRLTAEDDPRDDAVIVYLLRPPAGYEVGDKVRTVGRFYKVWRNYVAHGEENVPLNCVVLVADTVEPLDALPASGAMAGAGGQGPLSAAIKVAFGILLLLGFGFFMVRRFMKRAGMGPGRSSMHERAERLRAERSLRREDAEHHGNGDEDTAPALPVDPTDALAELERRRTVE